MRGALILSILLLGAWGCPPKPPVPPVNPGTLDMSAVQQISSCPANVLATISDSCDGFFYSDGDNLIACAVCPGGGACYDPTDGVYCASGGNCYADPRCRHYQDGMAAARPRKLKKPGAGK